MRSGRQSSEQSGLSKSMSLLAFHSKHLVELPKQSLDKIGLKLIWTSGESRFSPRSSEH